jgi:hypothetical protein
LDLFNFNNKYFKKLNHLIFLTKVRKWVYMCVLLKINT